MLEPLAPGNFIFAAAIGRSAEQGSSFRHGGLQLDLR